MVIYMFIYVYFLPFYKYNKYNGELKVVLLERFHPAKMVSYLMVPVEL